MSLSEVDSESDTSSLDFNCIDVASPIPFSNTSNMSNHKERSVVKRGFSRTPNKRPTKSKDQKTWEDYTNPTVDEFFAQTKARMDIKDDIDNENVCGVCFLFFV